MTEKPEVVAIIDKHRSAGVMLITHGHDSLKDGDKLIRLTDHEAARAADKARIAELEEENRRLHSAGQALEADYSSWRREVDHKAEFHEAQRNELLELLRDIKADLLRRAERDSDGCKVVNLGNGLWCRIEAALAQQDKENTDG